MDYPTFRTQLPTDKIHTVEERYSESDGPYQIAIGFDGEGNAIYLCNRGIDVANYCRTEFTREEKQFAIVKRLMAKRDKQMEHATKTGLWKNSINYKATSAKPPAGGFSFARFPCYHYPNDSKTILSGWTARVGAILKGI